MNQEQQESKEKINLLLNVINSTRKIPKFTDVIEDKKRVSRVTGSVEISTLNIQEFDVIKNELLKELGKLYPHLVAKVLEPEVTENPAQIPLEFKEEETKTN
jgi:hypothetical protein